MARIEVGDVVTLKNTFTIDGVGTSPDTVDLTVTAPDSTTTNPAVTDLGGGKYSATFTTAMAGLHQFQWVGDGTADDVQDGQFRVHRSADRRQYVGLGELKTALSITDGRDDASLQQALDTACRAIDRFCGRRFDYGDSGEVRYFTAVRADSVYIDDTITITEVALDTAGNGSFGTVVTEGTHFYAAPRAAVSQDAPYTRLQALSRGFTCGDERVRVTGTFGWPSCPPEVAQAALLQATRIWKRTREAPFGIAGLNLDGGGMRLLARLDPDVELLLRPLQTVMVA